MCVFHQNSSRALHTADAPAHVTQEHDVALHALHGEVFMQRAYHRALGLGDHGIKIGLRNRTAIHDGHHAGATAGLQPLVHAVAIEVDAEAAAIGGDAVRSEE